MPRQKNTSGKTVRPVVAKDVSGNGTVAAYRPLLVFRAAFHGIVVLLYIIAAVNPSPLSWGFHQFAFVPLPVRLILLTGLCLPLIPPVMNLMLKSAGRIDALSLKKPAVIGIGLISCIGGAVLLWVMRIRIPLFGDGIYLIGAFNTMKDLNGLQGSVGNAPFTGFLVYAVTRLLRSLHIADAAEMSMRLLSVGSGIAALVTVFLLSARMVKENSGRLLIVLLLCSAGFSQLFFGYVELYAFPLFLLVVYLFASYTALEQKHSVFIPTLAFGMLISSHAGMLWLFPTLLLLWGYQVRNKWLDVIISATALVAVHCALMRVSGYPPDHLVAAVMHSGQEGGILSVRNTCSPWHSYSLFSWGHLVDLFNLLMIVFPCAGLFALVLISRGVRRTALSDPGTWFSLLSLLCASGFLLLSNFRIGMSRDWDLCALFLAPAVIASVYLLVKSSLPATVRTRLLVPAIILTGIPTAALVSVNANEEHSLKRCETLPDSRLWSRRAIAYFYEDLSTWHRARLKIADAVRFIEESLRFEPENSRRWMLAMSYHLLNGQPQKADQALLNMAVHESGKAGEFIDRAVAFYTGKETDSALFYFQKALEIEKRPVVAYFAGTLLATKKADYTSALNYFNMAIGMDPSFALAYRNRGLCRMSLGDRNGMRLNFEKYFRLAPYDPEIRAMKEMINRAFTSPQKTDTE